MESTGLIYEPCVTVFLFLALFILFLLPLSLLHFLFLSFSPLFLLPPFLSHSPPLYLSHLFPLIILLLPSYFSPFSFSYPFRSLFSISFISFPLVLSIYYLYPSLFSFLIFIFFILLLPSYFFPFLFLFYMYFSYTVPPFLSYCPSPLFILSHIYFLYFTSPFLFLSIPVFLYFLSFYSSSPFLFHFSFPL